MTDLTLAQRFGDDVTLNLTAKTLTIDLNNLSSIVVGGVDVGLDVTAMTDTNKDEYSSRIIYSLLQLSQQNQPTDNTDKTVGVYVTNEGRRNVNRNSTAQIGYRLVATAHINDPLGTTLDPDKIGAPGGNFPCIESTSGRVVWREYLPAVVRWRYPGEDWQQLEADDYTIEDLPGQCCNSYEVTVSYEIANCKGGIANSGIGKVRIPNAIYQGVDYKLTTGFSRTQIVVKYFDCIQNKNKEKSIWSSSAKRDSGISCTIRNAIYSQG